MTELFVVNLLNLMLRCDCGLARPLNPYCTQKHHWFPAFLAQIGVSVHILISLRRLAFFRVLGVIKKATRFERPQCRGSDCRIVDLWLR